MSTAVTPRSVDTPRRNASGLDHYITAVLDANPFASNRVTEPSDYDVDVPGIHAAGFDRLVRLASEAMGAPNGLGVALLGGAGVGKSHLLSRLYRWSNEPGPNGIPRACYVYLHNVLADPDRLPRYLLKYVVSRLSHGDQGPLSTTPLFRFLDRAIRHALDTSGVKVDRIEDQLQQAVDAYLRHFVRAPEERTIYVTLLQFWRFARTDKADDPWRRLMASTALTWLSGDEIDPKYATYLGFKVDEQGPKPVMLGDDQDVQYVLRALTVLAHVSGQPMILCIDQFENLDPDKITPFSRFLHALLDRTPNLLIITSGVKQTLLSYREDGVIPEASWDRIAQRTVELNRIKAADARKIVEARLERFHDPFLELDEVRRRLHEDTLFPLGRDWLDRCLADGVEFRTRDILNRARDAWEEQQRTIAECGGRLWLDRWPGAADAGPVASSPSSIESLIDAVIDRKIEEQIEQHRLHPGSLPPDAGNLAGLVEALLEHCSGDGLPYTFRGLDRRKKKGGKLPPYDLLVREHRNPDGREVRTGLTCVTNVGNSATAALRRLKDDDPTLDHRLLVTDQERRPLKVGDQGIAIYQELERLGPSRFEHLKLDFEQYARLDALQGVIGMARSGDLEIEAPRGTTRPVIEAEVIASHHRRDRFRQHPLLRPLLTEEPASKLPVEQPRDLPVDRVRQFIMGQLAWRMGSMARALARGYAEEEMGGAVDTRTISTRFMEVARKMHAEGLIHATPQDDDLYLLLRK